MNTLRRRLASTMILLVLAVAAAGCALLQETGEASEPISAIPLATSETQPVDEGTVSEAAIGEEGDAEPTLFQIVQVESEARFFIDEILRGQPQTVVGVTDQIAAEIALDFNNPAETQIGTVRVNARTLVTDESRRNRAIGNWILETGQFEFIEFTPTAITGLPQEIVIGESVALEITGDLTIRDLTQEITFQATVTPVSESRLEGLASATINRGDFDLTIPSVPFVANVGEQVLLEIEFVATPGGGSD